MKTLKLRAKLAYLLLVIGCVSWPLFLLSSRRPTADTQVDYGKHFFVNFFYKIQNVGLKIFTLGEFIGRVGGKI